MKRVYKTGIVALILAILSSSAMAQGTPCVTSPIPPCVQSAINRGLNWLIANQNALGTWDYNIPTPTPDTFGVATASMAVIAFLENGYPPSHPTVCRAVNYIISNFHAGSGIYWDINPPGPDPFRDKINYQTSLAVIALIEFEKNCGEGCPIDLPDGIPDLHTLIQKAVDCIVGSQWNSALLGGGITYPLNWEGGFTYGEISLFSAPGVDTSHKRPDMSNTQFALWALCIAKGAGYNVPNQVWTHALNYVLARQHASGGFDYAQTPPPYYREVTGARTAMALMSLWFISCFISNPAINTAANNALTWWQTHYSYCCNPVENLSAVTLGVEDGYYYYAFSTVRAFQHWSSVIPGFSLAALPFTGALQGTTPGGVGIPCTPCSPPTPQHLNPGAYPTCCPGDPSFSTLPSWYKDFACQLINWQTSIGAPLGSKYWKKITPIGGFDAGNTIATLFALLALSRINLPPSMTPDHIRPIVDWTIPCDCECVCCDSCPPQSPSYYYICAHIQDGCCSQGINPESIQVKIDLACCSGASFTPAPSPPIWIPDDPSGTSGTVVVRVRCDSLCNPKDAFQCSYDSSYKVTVCLRAKDNAGNPLFPNPYTWSFTIDRDSPWVEMYYPLCLTCKDTTPHIIWPQDSCCGKHFWDGYFKFVTYHPCNLNCDTIILEYHVPESSIVRKILIPESAGITYKESYCTGELDSITVDLVEALNLRWEPQPPYYAMSQTVDTCFDTLKICLITCDHALDISRFNWKDSTCVPETVVCHRDSCCWEFHNVHIHRERGLEPGDEEKMRKSEANPKSKPQQAANTGRTAAITSRKRGCGCGGRKK